MLRFRMISGDEKENLITLKIAGERKGFQDNYEIEYNNTNNAEEKHAEINDVLIKHTGCSLESSLINTSDIFSLISNLADSGFVQCRMLSQKKREVFHINNQKVCIDTFPDPVGRFVELEAYTPDELYALQEQLKLSESYVIKSNYGKIIQDKQLHKSGLDQRICVFDASLARRLHDILRRDHETK